MLVPLIVLGARVGGRLVRPRRCLGGRIARALARAGSSSCAAPDRGTTARRRPRDRVARSPWPASRSAGICSLGARARFARRAARKPRSTSSSQVRREQVLGRRGLRAVVVPPFWVASPGSARGSTRPSSMPASSATGAAVGRGANGGLVRALVPPATPQAGRPLRALASSLGVLVLGRRPCLISADARPVSRPRPPDWRELPDPPAHGAVLFPVSRRGVPARRVEPSTASAARVMALLSRASSSCLAWAWGWLRPATPRGARRTVELDESRPGISLSRSRSTACATPGAAHDVPHSARHPSVLDVHPARARVLRAHAGSRRPRCSAPSSQSTSSSSTCSGKRCSSRCTS